jgi:hypothetical protein
VRCTGPAGARRERSKLAGDARGRPTNSGWGSHGLNGGGWGHNRDQATEIKMGASPDG